MRKKQKAKKSIRKKSIISELLILNAITIMLAVFISSGFALVSMNNTIKSTTQSNAITSLKVMKQQITSIQQNLEKSAQTIAQNSAVKNSAAAKNTIDLLNEVNKMAMAMNIKAVTVTDVQGSVLLRTNKPEKIGDSIANLSAVKNALKGSTYSDIESDKVNNYCIDASTPILDESGHVVGTVTASYSLENTEFVDSMKNTMGDEFTVFSGDTRISTTIMNEGERAVGTKLDSKIADIVINQKKEYVGRATIFGNTYITMYSPVLSKDDQTVTGILYAGRETSADDKRLMISIIAILVLSAVIVTVSVLIGIQYMRIRLKKPIKKVVDASESIANGQLDSRIMEELGTIKRNDEIGILARSMEGAVLSIQNVVEDTEILANAALNNDLTVTVDSDKHNGIYKKITETVQQLFAEMTSILEEIKTVADQISGGSGQVSSASQMLAQGASEQASSTQELAATIDELTAHIANNAQNADHARSLSEEAGNDVENSNEHMAEMLAAMDEISRTSNEISKIIKTIEDIAFQTNILALNASVEAARAGAAGKGFAVVADEVRNLATKSAEAAKGTTDLIDNAIAAVEKGGSIAQTTEEALKSAALKANQVRSLVNEISEAASKQSDSINQINMNVEQITTVVQTTSATAEETAASSEELAAQSQSLQNIVDKYKL